MAHGKIFQFHLDDLGYCFVKKCIGIVEARGLDDQGLYRIGGVNSRVARLLQMCLDRKNYNTTTRQVNMPDFSDPVEWETKTITSALKNYLRNLSEPIMTYDLHPAVIEAAKIDNTETRTNKIRSLIQRLPAGNFTLLKLLVGHLKNVASHSQKNLMTISNLGICFAPTLMRGPEESALSIMEIKYSNVVANTLIEEYDSIFNDPKMIGSHYHQNPQQQQHHHHHHHHPNTHTHHLNHQNNGNSNINSQHHYNNNKNTNGNNNNAQNYQPQPYQSLPEHIQFPDSSFVVNSDDRYCLHNNSQMNTTQVNQKPPLQHHQHIHPQQSFQSLPQPICYTNTTLVNVDDHFGLALPNQQQIQFNSNQIHSMPYYAINPTIPELPYRSDKVVTLYACVADTESELSFSPNEIITDVRTSAEVGWLVGTLERNGQRGLLPENYVMFI